MTLTNQASVSTVVEILLRRAVDTPHELAYAIGADGITYSRLRDDACHIASVLAARGLEPGGRCALVLPTGLAFVRALYGVQLLGAAAVAIDPDLPHKMALRRLKLVRCGIAVVETDARSLRTDEGWPAGIEVLTVKELAAAPATGAARLDRAMPDGPALLLFTSGTSGEQKAAVILHEQLLARLRSSQKRVELRPDDVLVNWVPLHHSLGLVRFAFGALFSGCPVHLVRPSIANLRVWLETITRERGTVTGSPDFGYRAAAEIVDTTAIDLRSLRFAMSGGESIRLSTVERFEQKFLVPDVIRPGYGLAEANGVSTVGPGERRRIDAAGNISCGRPVDGLEVEVVDDDGRCLRFGQPGEIRVRGSQVFAGYFDDEAATRAVLRDGWLYTGDIGQFDADGYLYVVGRRRALIKRGGATIVPHDIEQAAEQVGGVLRAAAIGLARPASLGAEDIVAVAEIDMRETAGSTCAQVAQAIADKVTRSTRCTPTDVILVRPQTIPRTANGKVRYEELKRILVAGELRRQGLVLFGGRPPKV